MPARRADENCVRKHIFVDIDDWQWFEEKFGESLGTSRAIRLVMRKYRKALEARVAEVAERPKVGELDFETQGGTR